MSPSRGNIKKKLQRYQNCTNFHTRFRLFAILLFFLLLGIFPILLDFELNRVNSFCLGLALSKSNCKIPSWSENVIITHYSLSQTKISVLISCWKDSWYQQFKIIGLGAGGEMLMFWSPKLSWSKPKYVLLRFHIHILYAVYACKNLCHPAIDERILLRKFVHKNRFSFNAQKWKSYTIKVWIKLKSI